MRVLIIGCGYVGVPLGRSLASDGHEVFGLRRSSAADSELITAGIGPLHADVTDLNQLQAITPRFDWVINLVSSTRGGPEEYSAVYLQGTRNILTWLQPHPPLRFIYTSSTSVYAQDDGSIVEEGSLTAPTNQTSRILLETENELLQQKWLPSLILRVAGIYGPGRGHLFKQFLRDEAVLRGDGESYTNMIHLADLAAAIVHLLKLPASPTNQLLNIVDDEPVKQREFFEWLAGRLGKPMPPSVPPDPARKRGLTNKLVSNAKLKATNFSLIYPTFREGYESEIKGLNH
jgi:nucleoside-diphosphate-sugar epimerase